MNLKNTNIVLNDFARVVMESYKEALKKDNRVASGNLINSLDFKVDSTDYSLIVTLYLADYWEEIEFGRKKTENDGPGEVRVKIADWITQKGIQPKADANGKIPTPKQLLFLIARKIHEKGFDGGLQKNGKGYLEGVLEKLTPKYLKLIEAALKKDADIEFFDNMDKYLKRGLEGI